MSVQSHRELEATFYKLRLLEERYDAMSVGEFRDSPACISTSGNSSSVYAMSKAALAYSIQRPG